MIEAIQNVLKQLLNFHNNSFQQELQTQFRLYKITL
jgi:hypothetical protein